ncbi:MAG: leucyl/phenylalanyl-tRNA--protein transferase [Methylomonas sp.]|nr:leucyl/phenylalanyl-tRNA--protein transferase [Methylomonas sp.]PPD21961.1 MAG: leucyl/phenylalanyl-tRNA--protein transferase [Methylomonas sp.]PPD25013.1 MAG: leucyl/phenylalanyl-tRNA--protein transferase [Methylomonas sp.]PPD34353.1 MAG: leucyl/phenylalanyl-tRNA--protein transferase [Methylomonas sp.]PPD39200.1 MAG: leucyl/phenylalanyl-tRNA--protein transferase [Methylomonas sp.]
MALRILDAGNPNQAFPDCEQALSEPDGLLAIGGCLSPERLINAYRSGLFPWYNPGEPILWWSPDPRLVLLPAHLVVSKSLRKTLRKRLFDLSFDRAFNEVIDACSSPRSYASETWISQEMQQAYQTLHGMGIAHSVEAWQDGKLVGGLYGVAIGRVFFGESMFHRVTDASKVAFIHAVEQLVDWGYELIDCQVSTEHLLSLGAEEMPRTHFIQRIGSLCGQSPKPTAWTL